jgi:hypothetical protein
MSATFDTRLTFPFDATTGRAGTGPLIAKHVGHFIYHAPADIDCHRILNRSHTTDPRRDAPCNIVPLHHDDTHMPHHQAGGKRLAFVPGSDMSYLMVLPAGTLCTFWDPDTETATKVWRTCECCDLDCERRVT